MLAGSPRADLARAASPPVAAPPVFVPAQTRNYEHMTFSREPAKSPLSPGAPTSFPSASALPDDAPARANSTSHAVDPPPFDRSAKVPVRSGSHSEAPATRRQVYSAVFARLQAIPDDGRLYDDIREQLDLSAHPDAAYAMPDELRPASAANDSQVAAGEPAKDSHRASRSVYDYLWPDEPKYARVLLPKGLPGSL